MSALPGPVTAGPVEVEAALALSSWWSRPLPDVVDRWRNQAALATRVAEALGTRPTEVPGRVEEGPPRLLAEYERLFVGPGMVPCPPYESYWRQDVPIDIRRTLMGPCVGDLTRLYAQLGLGLEDTPEMADHVAVELEALGVALASGHPEVARALLADHLLVWIARLGRAVARETTSAHYARLARVTRSWLEELAERTGAGRPLSD